MTRGRVLYPQILLSAYPKELRFGEYSGILTGINRGDDMGRGEAKNPVIAYDRRMEYSGTLRPNDPISSVGRVGKKETDALARLHLASVKDLLYHFPVRYIESGASGAILDAEDGEKRTLYGRVQKTATKRSFRGHIPMGEAFVTDGSGKMKLIWFGKSLFLAKTIKEGDIVRAMGTVKTRAGVPTLVNPEIEIVDALPETDSGSLFRKEEGETPRFFPVYPETKGLSSTWFYHKILRVLHDGAHDAFPDPIPEDIRRKYNLPSLETALVWIHTPRDKKHAESARKRFAFEEIFFIQLERQRGRMLYEKNPAYTITPKKGELHAFTKRFGFPLTNAQGNSIATILRDFASSRPMLRLLEGDVGSGKTAVAAVSAYAVVSTHPGGKEFGNLGVAYMCPTEILATQHFESFIKYFIGTGIQIGLITGSGCRKFPSKVDPGGWTKISRPQLLKWVLAGEIPIIIGTHVLIQKSVAWKHLAYVIIDEQHRFGTAQRAKLVQKGGVAPHLLSMTATPIPRTLALTLYGDLDLTLLDEMPKGRKRVITEIVSKEKRGEAEEKMRAELSTGRQLYVICPRIDEPDPEKEQALIAKSVTEEAKRLRENVFPEYSVGILHSKMKPAEKDKVMKDFSSGKTRILCATSVVEVGVNVPNATMIVIEGAERFGLAQLHQLRGRVLRSESQAYCYLFSETQGKNSRDRLRALVTAKNGFELSEMDLTLRGVGELSGGKQWGISDIGMEAIKNLKMVEVAREEARRILGEDITLAKYPTLRSQLENRARSHFE